MIVVVTDLRKIALLPPAAVDESHLIDCELSHVICVEIRNDGVRVFSGITDDVRHWGFLPALVELRMTLRTRF
jgi:hypothetical protein